MPRFKFLKRGIFIPWNMTYWGSDKNNWTFDRRKRRKLFELLKGNYNSPIRENSNTDKKESAEPFTRNTKFDQIVSIIGAVLKLLVFLLIFYIMAMLISHGKHWPE